MAMEVCSEDPSLGLSPRISFSHDISQAEIVPVEQYVRSSSSSSSMDFDFCVFRESFDLDSSSADELFFNGKILPIEIKRRMGGPPRKQDPPKAPQPPKTPPPPAPTSQNHDKKETSGETKPETLESSSDGQKQSGSKVFWKFKRSSSLNCGSGYARTLCPLPLLSRSNSTGSSSPIPKRTLSRDSFNLKHQSQKSSSCSASSTKQQSYNFFSASNHKPPSKKFQASTSSYSSNGVRVNPVLNVPPANLFGLGSMFSHGKDKNKKK
nr:probable membrane-associated kinase regulator 1 [Ipomoea batatas]GMD57029.1 probable membrane-associated kinase regulator 1 [Ipomoea batatas]